MFTTKIWGYHSYDKVAFSFISRSFANKADALEWAGKKVMPLLLTHCADMGSIHYHSYRIDVEVFEDGVGPAIHTAYFSISE